MTEAFNLFFDGLNSIFWGTPQRKKEYEADFISPSALLSPYEKGFCLSGDKNLSLRHSFQNALIVAATGMGKSSVVLINSAFTMKGSQIYHDPSGEIFNAVSGALQKKGFLIKQLNFSNANFSCGYNPIYRANTSSEIQKVAAILIEVSLGSDKKDPFWTNSAIFLLVIIIKILKTQEEKYQNLYNALFLVETLGASPEKIDRLFSSYADEILFNQYKSFLSADDKVFSGVISTVKAALFVFNDLEIARVTSCDSIDMDSFRSKKIALFIQNGVMDQRYFSPLISCLFEQFFGHVLSRIPSESEQPIFFMIDEASSIKPPVLPLALANCRKHRAGILLAIQDYAQLVHNFGRYEAESIKSNCFSKLFFGGLPLETSTELSKILGKYEFTDKEDRKVIRELMTPDEIRKMQSDTGLLLCGNYSPILTPLVPYYKSRRARALASIPPAVIQSSIPETVPLLPLHD